MKHDNLISYLQNNPIDGYPWAARHSITLPNSLWHPGKLPVKLYVTICLIFKAKNRPTSDEETRNHILKVEELDAKTGGTAALDAHHWEEDRISHGIPENHEKVVEGQDQVNARDHHPHEEEVHILDVPEYDVGDRRLVAQEDQQENEPLHSDHVLWERRILSCDEDRLAHAHVHVAAKDKYRDFSLSQYPCVDLHKKMEEVNENEHVCVQTLERAGKKLEACLVPQDDEKKEVEVILGNNYEWSKARGSTTLEWTRGLLRGSRRAQVKPDLRDIGINADSARVGVKDISELVDLEVQHPDRAPECGVTAVTVYSLMVHNQHHIGTAEDTTTETLVESVHLRSALKPAGYMPLPRLSCSTTARHHMQDHARFLHNLTFLSEEVHHTKET
ncbi:hypothetical protein DL96DRAFT_1558157 [Flagelloscypha sp. PMI_526]|nr:hypothetical protein DL96DRAFT_1558157 [Flagelloscypha sp. PMI_526]